MYYLAQSEDYRISSPTGEFKNVDLAKEFTPGRDIYAYVVSKSGAVAKLEKTALSVEHGKNDLTGILSTGSIKLGGDLEVTIPDDFPVIGGNTFGLSMGAWPIYAEYDNGRIKVGFNISTDDDGYNMFKEYGKKMAKYKNAEEKFAIGKKLMKRYGRKTSAMKLAKDIEAELSFGGYVEMELTSSGLVPVEGQLMLMLDVNGSLTKQFLHPIPCYIGITIGAKSGVTARSRTAIRRRSRSRRPAAFPHSSCGSRQPAMHESRARRI